jgi:hypothetical protein
VRPDGPDDATARASGELRCEPGVGVGDGTIHGAYAVGHRDRDQLLELRARRGKSLAHVAFANAVTSGHRSLAFWWGSARLWRQLGPVDVGSRYTELAVSYAPPVSLVRYSAGLTGHQFPGGSGPAVS